MNSDLQELAQDVSNHWKRGVSWLITSKVAPDSMQTPRHLVFPYEVTTSNPGRDGSSEEDLQKQSAVI